MSLKKQSSLFLLGFFATALFLLFRAAPGFAGVVNVDFEGDPPDTTHGLDDGVFSNAGGTTWNSVDFDTDESDLDDEFGAGTPVDVDMGPEGFASSTNAAPDNLRDSGTNAPFRILGLIELNLYDLALYYGVLNHNWGTSGHQQARLSVYGGVRDYDVRAEVTILNSSQKLDTNWADPVIRFPGRNACGVGLDGAE